MGKPMAITMNIHNIVKIKTSGYQQEETGAYVLKFFLIDNNHNDVEIIVFSDTKLKIEAEK